MFVKDLINKNIVSYAQNNEDIILGGFFDIAKGGFYVDVGASDPINGSVTKYFYDRGWSGINIEPIKSQYLKLTEHRPRDINLNIGISNKHGELKFRDYEGNGLSTFSKEMMYEYTKNPSNETDHYKDYLVRVVTLEQILKEYNVDDIQFMKIDVEGLEYEVIEGNDWRIFRPNVLCIEANHVKKDWRKLLAINGYIFIFFDGLNEYYIDNNKPDTLKHFSFVDSVILREPIINYLLVPQLKHYEIEISNNIKALEKEVLIKNELVANLNNRINEITPLRKHFKRQLKKRIKRVDSKIAKHLLKDQKNKVVDTRVSIDTISDEDLSKVTKNIDKINYENFINRKQYNLSYRTYMSIKRYIRVLFKR